MIDPCVSLIYNHQCCFICCVNNTTQIWLIITLDIDILIILVPMSYLYCRLFMIPLISMNAYGYFPGMKYRYIFKIQWHQMLYICICYILKQHAVFGMIYFNCYPWSEEAWLPMAALYIVNTKPALFSAKQCFIFFVNNMNAYRCNAGKRVSGSSLRIDPWTQEIMVHCGVTLLIMHPDISSCFG